MTHPAEITPKTTIFYDGSCPLCRAEIGYYQDRDKSERLQLVDVSSQDQDLPETLDPETAMARFHVLSHDGRLVSGAEGFVEVWKQVPGWGWAARIAAVPGVLSVLELGYRGFLFARPLTVRVFIAVRRLMGKSNADV